MPYSYLLTTVSSGSPNEDGALSRSTDNCPEIVELSIFLIKSKHCAPIRQSHHTSLVLAEETDGDESPHPGI